MWPRGLVIPFDQTFLILPTTLTLLLRNRLLNLIMHLLLGGNEKLLAFLPCVAYVSTRLQLRQQQQ